MTTVALFHFPINILWEAQVSWEITSQMVGSGQTASGVSPTTRIDGGGAWKLTLSEVNLLWADARRTWRSLSAICDGGSNPIVVPMRDIPDVPYPTSGGVLLTRYDDINHTDDVPFASGVGYQVGTVDASLVGAALLNATSLTIAISGPGTPGTLRGGEHFSINHPVLRYRMYRIRTVKDNGDGTWNVTIRPPLRANTPDGTLLDFATPKCVMRLASGKEMDAAFEPMWISRPTASFIEAFPPFPVP